ncbi:MAG: glycosyltransferase [Gammaproteobacteria bacterium]|nr:glycosyltransferase [Gammaproteobacteria bacterium]
MTTNQQTRPPLRIILLASSYPRSADDSASIFLRHLARYLAKEGLEVHVLAPHDPAVRHDLHDPGVKIHRYRYPTWRRRLAYGSGILPNLRANPWLALQLPGFLIAQLGTLLWLGLRLRPNLIHAHWILPQGLVGVLVGSLLRIPVVTTAHGGDAFALKGAGPGALKRWVLRRSRHWTANTEATAGAVTTTRGIPAPAVIPMGVEVQHFSTGDGTALKKRLGESHRVILFVGRLVEKKGVTVLLEAYAKLPRDTRQSCRLWIVGDGDDRKDLEQQSRELHITEGVWFAGRVTNQNLPDYYGAADIFVAPSIVDESGDTEGQGVVLLEAMAAGAAIVASRVGGIGEVIEDGVTGTLVPPRDPEALAHALETLLTTPATVLTHRHAARERVEQAYDWPGIAARFAALYHQPPGR